jgi:hypothetical protein
VVLNHSAISKLFNESELFVNSKQWFDDIFFVYVSKTIFGISPESLDAITKDSVFQAVCERFKDLSIEDVKIAFRTHTQTEKVYILTRDEFLKPIQNFWNKKMIVKRELDIELEKLKNEKQAEIEKQRFKSESEQMYLNHFNNGLAEWTGSDFQANQFAMCFKEQFSQERKNELWINAQREFKERNALFNDGAIELPPPPERFIFSRMIVNEALSNRKMLILE